MREESNQQNLTPKLFEDFRTLTDKTMSNISSIMEDPDAMLKYAKQFRDIALTLEKMGKLIANIDKIGSLLNSEKPQATPKPACIDNATPRERREQIEATINYFENIKQWGRNYLDDQMQKEASDEQKPLAEFNNTS